MSERRCSEFGKRLFPTSALIAIHSNYTGQQVQAQAVPLVMCMRDI